MQTVGDVQKDVGGVQVWILTGGGSAEAKTHWTAVPGRWHNIYVEITPDPKETTTENNKAFKRMEVLSGNSGLLWYIFELIGQFNVFS